VYAFFFFVDDDDNIKKKRTKRKTECIYAKERIMNNDKGNHINEIIESRKI